MMEELFGKFNFNDDDMEKIENHPLNIFAKLCAEDSRNKVYKECLENEITTAIEQISNSADAEMIVFLKQVMDNCKLDEDDLKILTSADIPECDSYSAEEIKMKTYVTKKIIDGVYNKIKQEHNND